MQTRPKVHTSFVIHKSTVRHRTVTYSKLPSPQHVFSRSCKGRIFPFSLFLFSFILHSNLCFYAVALLMIGMKEKKVTAMHGYLDYLLLPVLFFAVKSLFFPAYGGYENYNAITGAGLIKAGFYLLPAVIYVMRALFVNFCGIGKNAFFVIGILLLISYLIQNIRKIIGGGDKDSFKRRRKT